MVVRSSRGVAVKSLWRIALILTAVVLLLFAGGFLFRALTVGDGSTFARLTADSTIFAFALAAVSAALAMATFAVRMKRPRTGSPLSDRDALERAARDLADVAHRHWADEAAVRGLLCPQPMRVRWSATGRPVAAHPADVLDQEGLRGRRARLRLSGDLTEIVSLFRSLPRRQVVVLGEPGAGKSVLAMLLALGLLGKPEPAEPVPVLLPVSSWDPGAGGEHLGTWIARRLVEDYPFLANSDSYGPEAATGLVTAGLVMPILDGLDELPPELLDAAITGIDRAAVAVGRMSPLVVTCRTTDYEDAVASTGKVLATAAVIELEQVEPAAAAAFLTEGGAQATSRWHDVLARLEPSAPLAQALTSPLMVALARAIYTDPATSPAELLDTSKFPIRDAVENHLLSEFVPAIYADSPRSPYAPATAAPLAQYGPDRARQWLAFLADHLTRLRSRDLAWWQLISGVPRPARILLSTAAFATFFAPTTAVVMAATAALAHGLSAGLTRGIIAGLCGAVPAGLGYGIGSEIAGTPGPSRSQLRFRLRAPSPAALGISAVGFGAVGASIGGPLLGLLLALTGVVVVALWDLLESPADVQQFIDPSSIFGEDLRVVRVRGVVFWLGTAVVGLYIASPRDAIISGIGVGLTGGLISGLGTKAWGRFTVARVWLVATRRLPFRTTAFLEDAHQRGALRRVGAIYQFRHAALQTYLSGHS
jgi:hypothetical protein